MRLCGHAMIRMSQRGFRTRDVDLFLECGTKVSDGYFLRDRDVTTAILQRQKEIERLERLRGKVLIADGDTVVTAYKPSRKRERRLLKERL